MTRDPVATFVLGGRLISPAMALDLNEQATGRERFVDASGRYRFQEMSVLLTAAARRDALDR